MENCTKQHDGTECSQEGRIWLGGVDRGQPQIHQKLHDFFSHYGRVEEIFIPSRSTKKYAFVTFEDATSVDVALKANPAGGSPGLFSAMHRAGRIRQPSKRKSKEIDEWKEKYRLAQSCNVVIQVQRSHLDRLSDLIEEECSQCSVLGSTDTDSTNVALLYCFAAHDGNGFVEYLESHQFATVAVNAVYIVSRPVVRGSLEVEAADRLWDLLGDVPDGSTVRANAFPPSIRPSLLATLDSQRAKDKTRHFELSPRGATHRLHFVSLDSSEGLDGRGALFLLGISRQPSTSSDVPAGIPERTCDISRAFYKLEEAFLRYKSPVPSGNNYVCLDCGAAPGGWTKFLLDQTAFGTSRIYSVDPGTLSSLIMRNKKVVHLASTIGATIPLLCARNVHVQIWVSDMCVKDMSDQIMWLLKARSAGLVGQGTFYVLTLKCVIGYSRESHARQVEQAVAKIRQVSRDVNVLHLFRGRSSERTVIGYLQ